MNLAVSLFNEANALAFFALPEHAVDPRLKQEGGCIWRAGFQRCQTPLLVAQALQ